MKRAILAYILAVSIVFAGVFSTPALAVPCANANGFLGFPAWFKGLQCDPVAGGGQTVNMGGKIENIWVIVLNIIQILIVAAGYIAVYFVAWGGFQYIKAAGEPDKIKSAKDTLVNAIIGLIIVLASVAIVRTIQAGIIGTIK